MYEEIQESHLASGDVTTASSNQTSALHHTDIQRTFGVYATVTKRQPDLNHSANQVANTEYDYYASLESSEVTVDDTECMYVTVKHKQNDLKDDSLIYSLINK